LRALYQRKKGRDLFDLHYALTNIDLNIENIMKCYKEYIAFSVKNPPTKKQYLSNMEEKIADPDFRGDIYGLLRPGIEFDQDAAYELIKNDLIAFGFKQILQAKHMKDFEELKDILLKEGKLVEPYELDINKLGEFIS